MKDNRSVIVWAILVSLAVSLTVNFKLARNVVGLSSRVERLNTVDSFRALEDSLIGRHVDLQNLLLSRNYGEHASMEDPRKFLVGFISYETHYLYAKQPGGSYEALCVTPDTAWIWCDTQWTLSCSESATCN